MTTHTRERKGREGEQQSRVTFLEKPYDILHICRCCNSIIIIVGASIVSILRGVHRSSIRYTF